MSDNITSGVNPQAPQGNKEYITVEELKSILNVFKEDLLSKVENAVEKVATFKIQNYIDNTFNSLVESKILELNKRMGGAM